MFSSIELINKKNNISVKIESFIKDTGVLLTHFEDGGIQGEFSKAKGAGQNGTSINSSSLGERPINIEGVILADSREQIDRIKNKIIKLLNPLQDILVKYSENDKINKEIIARAEGTVDFSADYKTNNNVALGFKVDLVCANPFWKSIKEHETTLVTWIPNLEFPAQESEGIELFHTEQKPNYWLETQIGGNTLINLLGSQGGENIVIDKTKNSINTTRAKRYNVNLTANKDYTLIIDILKATTPLYLYSLDIDNKVSYENNYLTNKEGRYIVKLNNKTDIKSIFLYMQEDQFDADKILEFNNVMLLEGDWTNYNIRYLEYFEGIKIGEFEEFESEFGQGIGQEWGYREIRQIIEVNNIGDVECPLKVMFRANGDVEKPYIQDVETYELLRINRTLKSGDVLEITTGYGNKNVYLNGKKAHQYLDFLNSSWLQLKPGINLIKYGAEKGLNNLECTVFYTPLYLGV
ncbi:phage tail family protein [Clostridium sporogenes]|uniref:phage tail family protein n=1 Tax=Clostridium sporogenes TaxID=1509 RepID=UPI00223850BF|nr:phage tail family protein [Clostridium sporogenes]MCW6112422.1 phage tail family protein [Clostridium sporogenes]